MGYYIEGNKKGWLEKNAKLLGFDPPDWREVPEDSRPVCLTDNGPYLAAAIIYSERELERWTWPDDPRPKVWFMAKIEDLRKVNSYFPLEEETR